MAKIQGICPGQRIIRDSELGFGVKKFRIQGISSGTAGDPGKRDPGQRGATVLVGAKHLRLGLSSWGMAHNLVLYTGAFAARHVPLQP